MHCELHWGVISQMRIDLSPGLDSDFNFAVIQFESKARLDCDRRDRTSFDVRLKP